MTDTSSAFSSELFSLELATLLFWIVNAAWVVVVLYGLIAHRSLAAAYAFAAMWVMTLCFYVAAPMVTKSHLSLVDSFFLLSAVVCVAQVIFDGIATIRTAFGFAKSRDSE